jgi:hypothetical protein
MVAALSNCTVAKQGAMTLSLSLSLSLSTFSTLSHGVKTSTGSSSQQDHMYAVQEVLLLHDNAQLHSAVAAVEAIRRLKFELSHISHIKKALVHENLPVMMKLRTRCIRGFDHNRK